jgi:thiamine biosynthesis lipoprotein
VPTQDLRRHVETLIADLDLAFSPWRADSVLSRFNAGGALDMSVGADLAKVTQAALAIAAKSNGCFDPTVGPLVARWGFGPITQGAARPGGWRGLAADDRHLERVDTALTLDLCGIAKGYAVDLVTRYFRDAGVASALVEIGGELSGYGIKPDGTPWWVAIDGDPAVEPPLLAALHGLAIATSGSERAFEHEGSNYSHTIDPRTGGPIDNGMISASVLHEQCMLADSYATALMVMGPGRAIAFADAHGLAAVIRYRSGNSIPVVERISARLQAMLDG